MMMSCVFGSSPTSTLTKMLMLLVVLGLFSSASVFAQKDSPSSSSSGSTIVAIPPTDKMLNKSALMQNARVAAMAKSIAAMKKGGRTVINTLRFGPPRHKKKCDKSSKPPSSGEISNRKIPVYHPHDKPPEWATRFLQGATDDNPSVPSPDDDASPGGSDDGGDTSTPTNPDDFEDPGYVPPRVATCIAPAEPAGPRNLIQDATDPCYNPIFDPSHQRFGCWGRRTAPRETIPPSEEPTICQIPSSPTELPSNCYGWTNICDAQPPFGYLGPPMTQGRFDATGQDIGRCTASMPRNPVLCNWSVTECWFFQPDCRIGTCEPISPRPVRNGTTYRVNQAPQNPGFAPALAYVEETYQVPWSYNDVPTQPTSSTDPPAVGGGPQPVDSTQTSAPLPIGRRSRRRALLSEDSARPHFHDKEAFHPSPFPLSPLPQGATIHHPSEECSDGFFLYGEYFFCALHNAIQVAQPESTIFAFGTPTISEKFRTEKSLEIHGRPKSEISALKGKIWQRGSRRPEGLVHPLNLLISDTAGNLPATSDDGSAGLMVFLNGVSLINFEIRVPLPPTGERRPSSFITVGGRDDSITLFQNLHFKAQSDGSSKSSSSVGLRLMKNSSTRLFILNCRFEDVLVGVFAQPRIHEMTTPTLSSSSSSSSPHLSGLISRSSFRSTSSIDRIHHDEDHQLRHFGLLDFNNADLTIENSFFGYVAKNHQHDEDGFVNTNHLLVSVAGGVLDIRKSKFVVVDDAAIFVRGNMNEPSELSISDSIFMTHRNSKTSPQRATVRVERAVQGGRARLSRNTFIRISRDDNDSVHSGDVNYGTVLHFARHFSAEQNNPVPFTAQFEQLVFQSQSFNKTLASSSSSPKCQAKAEVLRVEDCTSSSVSLSSSSDDIFKIQDMPQMQSFRDDEIGCQPKSCKIIFGGCQMHNSCLLQKQKFVNPRERSLDDTSGGIDDGEAFAKLLPPQQQGRRLSHYEGTLRSFEGSHRANPDCSKPSQKIGA